MSVAYQASFRATLKNAGVFHSSFGRTCSIKRLWYHYAMKKRRTQKLSVVPIILTIGFFALVCVAVLLIQHNINLRTVHGNVIDPTSYEGLTLEKVRAKLKSDGPIVKYESIDGNSHIMQGDVGSCYGYLYVTVEHDLVTHARYEPDNHPCH